MSYWILIKPFLKYIIPFVIGGVLFGGLAWKFQGARLDACKADKGACISANAENTKTIDALQADIAKGNKTCEERLKSKDSTIRKLKDIDDLRGKDEKNPSSGNPLRDAVNGMWVNK